MHSRANSFGYFLLISNMNTCSGYGYYLGYLLLSAIFICCLVLASSALLSNKVYAHALIENTAKVTLRDGQVEILQQLALPHWKAKLQDNQAWLMGEISGEL